MVDKKNLFEGRATTQTKNAKFVSFQKMVDKKKPFFVCIFCFKIVFFFEKILFVCVVALPSNTIFEKIQSFC